MIKTPSISPGKAPVSNALFPKGAQPSRAWTLFSWRIRAVMLSARGFRSERPAGKAAPPPHQKPRKVGQPTTTALRRIQVNEKSSASWRGMHFTPRRSAPNLTGIRKVEAKICFQVNPSLKLTKNLQKNLPSCPIPSLPLSVSPSTHLLKARLYACQSRQAKSRKFHETGTDGFPLSFLFSCPVCKRSGLCRA